MGMPRQSAQSTTAPHCVPSSPKPPQTAPRSVQFRRPSLPTNPSNRASKHQTSWFPWTRPQALIPHHMSPTLPRILFLSRPRLGLPIRASPLCTRIRRTRPSLLSSRSQSTKMADQTNIFTKNAPARTSFQRHLAVPLRNSLGCSAYPISVYSCRPLREFCPAHLSLSLV